MQTIAKGTDADLAVTLLMGCVVKMSVTGTVATALPGQSCMIMLPNGLGVTAAITSGTFTVTVRVNSSAAFADSHKPTPIGRSGLYRSFTASAYRSKFARVTSSVAPAWTFVQ